MHLPHMLRGIRICGWDFTKLLIFIATGGMFEYVTGANFFGEITEWTGFAIMAGSLPAVAFAIFTAANIGPRALQHHQWVYFLLFCKTNYLHIKIQIYCLFSGGTRRNSAKNTRVQGRLSFHLFCSFSINNIES